MKEEKEKIDIGALISKAFRWLTSSADNHSNGASGRKLTAITIVALMIYGHLHWVDHDNYYDIHFLDVVFVCVLLGIVTIEQVIKLFAARTGRSITEENTETTKTSESTNKTTVTNETNI